MPPVFSAADILYIAATLQPSKGKLLCSECQTSGTYLKRAKQATKRQRLGSLVFPELPSHLRPEVDRAISILPWVVSRGRSYGFLWAVHYSKKCEEGQSNSGLFADKRLKTPHGAC
jgi:hypothetical protein